MDAQTAINVAFTLSGACGGWVIHILWGSIKELRERDKEHADKIGRVEVLVAGNYVTREEHQRMSDVLFQKLDRIERKLDGKVDR